jgi:hypothetical protein
MPGCKSETIVRFFLITGFRHLAQLANPDNRRRESVLVAGITVFAEGWDRNEAVRTLMSAGRNLSNGSAGLMPVAPADVSGSAYRFFC